MTEGLKLSEKQPGYGRITVLVGPDGGGKSYLSHKLSQENPDAILIDGTHPQNWPIPNEKKKSIARLKDVGDKDSSFDYYGILGLELHKMILKLAKQGKDVIVDSEQTFKWLMWEDMKGNLDKSIQTLTSNNFNAILPDTIKYVVPEAKNFDEQVEIIWQRLEGRDKSKVSPVDPKSLEETRTRLHASEHVILALEKLGVEIEGKPSWLK